MIVEMYDWHKFGTKIACTDCGIEDFIPDIQLVEARNLKIEINHKCKSLLAEDKKHHD